MADESRNPLELDAVVQKFAESTEALASVREQLRALTELREANEKANANLQQTAERVAGFAAKAADVLTGLEEAQTRVADVLVRGADLIDSNELKGIPEIVKTNSRSISRVDNRVDALESKVTALIANIDDLQSSLRQDLDSLKEDLQNIHADVRTPLIKRLF